LVAERLEGGPVSSRLSTFPDVFNIAEGGSKCTEGGRTRKPRVRWRLQSAWRLESLLTMRACLSSREDRVVLEAIRRGPSDFGKKNY